MKKKIGQYAYIILIISILIVGIHIINTYGINTLKEYIKDSGPFLPIAILLLRSTSIIIPALPSTAYSLLAGAVLGFKKGILIICLADIIACTCSFSLSRLYGKPLVLRLVGKKFINRVEDFNKKNIENNFLLMTSLLMTGLFDFVCYGIGLTKTTWKKFYPALLLSIGISNPPIVALGAGLLDGGKQILVFSILGLFVLSILSTKLKKKLNQ